MTDPQFLTPLEEYFLLEDRPAYPWSFFVRLDFSGRAERTVTETALSRCAARHPLLASRAARQATGAWMWRPVEQPRPVVRWSTDGIEPTFGSATRLDISTEIGLRLRATLGPDRTRFVFQFHHACCDARGALRMIEDWLAEYARIQGGGADVAEPRSYDPRLLERRGSVVGSPRWTPRAWQASWAGLMRAWRFVRRPPTPLVDYRSASDDEPAGADFPRARSFCFDATTTARLRAAARHRGATLNDVLCCNLFVVLCAFRAESPRDAWLRIAVPVDLRTAQQDEMSAANQASLVFLTRRPDDCRVPNDLLASLHRELRQVKTNRLANTFVRGLELRRRLPGGLVGSVRRRTCQATAALTNVGQTLDSSRLPRREGKLVAGDLLLEAVDFLPPIRPLTCVSFSACTYADRLAICLQYDPRALAEPAVGRLFASFVEGLHGWQ